MKKTLSINESTWERLAKLKLILKMRSFDDLLNYLCDKYEGE